MLTFSSHQWQRSQLVRGHDARVLAGVNTPLFQVPIEFEHGVGAEY